MLNGRVPNTMSVAGMPLVKLETINDAIQLDCSYRQRTLFPAGNTLILNVAECQFRQYTALEKEILTKCAVWTKIPLGCFCDKEELLYSYLLRQDTLS
mmetsp:Transcript_21915/g.33251  ORF Transcript_21915/g.33251 Transcript_21915/m.33251 type:complete len:98 (+) Transcript_21915:403-696(+)